MGSCRSCGVSSKREFIGMFLMYNIVHSIMHVVSLLPMLNLFIFDRVSVVESLFDVIYLNLFFHTLLALVIVFVENHRKRAYNWVYDY